MDMNNVKTMTGLTMAEAAAKLDEQLPAEAYTAVPGGADLTDIDPNYMRKVLNEVFGLCGLGWGYEYDPADMEIRSETRQGNGNARNVIVAALKHLRARATRVLTLTIPLDLGRPRAGTAVPRANALIRRLAGEHDAVCAELADLRGWRLLLPDAVHPTALGQLEIADRAARALAAAGTPVPRLPSALADPDSSRRAGARFAVRWGSLLARDLARRRVEAMHVRT